MDCARFFPSRSRLLVQYSFTFLVLLLLDSACLLNAANQPPAPNAGGPYTLIGQGSIRLDATPSGDPDPGDSIVSYEWDINGDGIFGDLTGPRPILARAATSLSPGSHPIALRVKDSFGSAVVGSASLTIAASPHLAILNPSGNIEVPGMPKNGLTLASDGKFYGVMEQGNNPMSSSLYRSNANGTGFTFVYNFGPIYGRLSRLIQADNERLYGTIGNGGGQGYGAIYSINTNGTDFVLIHTFDYLTDGRHPFAELVQASDGKLYGVTSNGGPNYGGTIFSLNPDGSGFTVLKALDFATEGGSLNAPLMIANNGLLYGVTYEGGPGHGGSLFSIAPNGTFTLLHSFIDSDNDPGRPACSLVQAANGKLYGALTRAGAGNVGGIFSINPDGSSFTLVRTLAQADGFEMNPTSLTLSADGRLYGIVGSQKIFRLNLDGSDFVVLPALPDSGYLPEGAGLIQLADGRFYGVIRQPSGALFSLSLQDELSLSSSFTPPVPPYRLEHDLMQASDGWLYTLADYGEYGQSAVLRIKPDGSAFNLVRSFPGILSYGSPSRLIQGQDGKLYGSTPGGGSNDQGILFSLTPDGTEFSLLHEFSVSSDGGSPRSGPIQANDGRLYGITNFYDTNTNVGAIYRINPDGTGFTVLHAFQGGPTDGRYPSGPLIQATDGRLYGTTTYGGQNNTGTIYGINLDGTEFSLVHSFAVTPYNNSYAPTGLIQASDGKLYGTTNNEGTSKRGTFYCVNLDGSGYTSLHSFNTARNERPQGALVQGDDQRFYGALIEDFRGGTIYALSFTGNYTPLHTFGTINQRITYLGNNLIKAPDGQLYGTATWIEAAARCIIFAYSNRSPSASLSYFPQAPATNASAMFDATASTDSDGDSLIYDWNFGDGITAAGPTPSHIYSAPGTYGVTLQVTDQYGRKATPLTVTIAVSAVASTGYSAWRQANFTSDELIDTAISGPNAVLSPDGLSNLMKYALGLDPKQTTITGLPELSSDGSNWIYTYTRPISRSDLTYTVQVSTNLNTWSAMGITQEKISTVAGIETWQAKFPAASTSSVFLRLVITSL